MKNEKGFSLLEVIIVCMVLAIVAGAVVPSAWKFYRQAAVEYEAEHLLSDLRRAQSMSRLTAENAWGYGAKDSQTQWACLHIYAKYSHLSVGTANSWNSKKHYFLPMVRVVKQNNSTGEIAISFDDNGNPVNNSMMTLNIYCDGYPNDGRSLKISRGGRIRMERRQS